MDWGEREIAIEIHCGAGQILTKNGSNAHIGIFGFMRGQITHQTNGDFQHGIVISWVISKSPRGSTSSFSGGP